MSTDHRTPSTPSLSNTLDIELLDRFVAGTCAAAEAAVVEAWLVAHPVHAELVQAMRNVPAGGITIRRAADVDAGWERFQTLVHEHSMRPTRKGVGRRGLDDTIVPLLRRAGWYALSSVIVGILGLVIGWHHGAHQLAWPTPRAVAVYATTNGQRATLTLLDGTTVALDVGSRLEVPADFGAGDHTVHLTGEALFTVSHHEGTPFTVVSGTTTARVLGTSFMMRHYTTDTATIVAVQEGKVAVDATVVTAHRLVEVERHQVLRRGSADSSRFTFATGVLTLDDMSLTHAIPELDRWYDAEVRLGDPTLASRVIGGTVTAGSLSELAEILELTLNVRVVREGRVLTLYSPARER